MNVRDIVKKAPNSILIVCGTIFALAVLASYVFLANSGKDAAEISRFVNTLLNIAGITVGGIAAVSAGSAATTSQEAKDAAEKAGEAATQAASQTNGVLDARIEAAITSALATQQEANARDHPNQGRLL